jgi:nitrite reductase (NADH) small subunit
VPASDPQPSFVGRLGDFRLNACTLVAVAGREVGIVPTASGVYAIANRCPHMGGGMCYGEVTGIIDGDSPDSLTYDAQHLAMRCPWHGWEFRLEDGSAVGGVTDRRLRRFPVEVRDDQVFVHLRAGRDGSDDSTDDARAASP